MSTDTPGTARPVRLPAWIRPSLQVQPAYATTAGAVRAQRLHTVCEEARCPNRSECWSRGTATFMLLGDTCTRACGFCSVATGRPPAIDPDEPRRVAEAAVAMNLGYVVLTSVNRDDLPDGGAEQFAATLRAIRALRPTMGLEILTPDFRNCQGPAIETIAPAAGAGLVWGHNVETVPRLYHEARRGASYERSLRLLELAAAHPGVEAKSALMLGLGEQPDEVLATLGDLRAVGVRRLALGQYLRPTREQLPVAEYITPTQFERYGNEARALGFTWVKSGPLVRSSYHAEE